MTTKNIKNILVSNVYSWKNKGDAAIVICLLQDLKKQFPSAQITLSTTDVEDKGKYGDFSIDENIQTILLKGVKKKLFRRIKIIKFLLGLELLKRIKQCFNIELFWLVPNEVAEKIRSYRKYDLVVACGGGYLLTRSKFDIFNVLLLVSDCQMADYFSIPYILYHQSVGPFAEQWHLRMLKKYLSNAKVIVCREKISYFRLKAVGLKNIVLKFDIAFLLKSEMVSWIYKKYDIVDKNKNVGLTMRKWLVGELHENYISSIKGLVDYFLQQDNTKVYFMPQVIFTQNNDNDLTLVKEIFDLPEYTNKVYIIDEDLSPQVLKGLIGKMDLFIGTRMHSNIFSLERVVKTIAIAYESKTRGIMDLLGLSEYVIEIEDVSTDRLVGLVTKIEEDDVYKSKLINNLNILKDNIIVDFVNYL